ncbi:NADPH-dependent F420 reductase [Paraflavitalea pollutisoli]|uniref:NADPH-dependent F420 reductase n=1 Tax=Paraflavitalea pollutisoli TaxID=3034143 RepID=UPI0023EC1D82|nr:NAD(P)-binding domain-containing protein [Paraflavitalea sp. H1-2-19X]
MSTQNVKVAVIGLGNIGAAVATNLVKGNRAIIVADRNEQKRNELAAKLGSLATPLDIPQAIGAADVIVLAVWFDVIKELLNTYSMALEGKIIVDPSNPIAPDEKGGFKKIIGEKESAGEIIANLLPKGAKLAKALGTLGAGSLSTAAFQQPVPAVLFYATDDTNINATIETLIQNTGFEPLRVGGIDQSIRIEVFGELHEFGALGKVTTKVEVADKI